MRPHALPVTCQVMPPWFALLSICRLTGPGIWRQRRTRSQTQLANGLSRTPPTRIYTTKARCPWHGGLLRIHGLASTCTSCPMPGDAIFRLSGPGIWRQRRTRSQTQLANGLSRTPPTRIYTTTARCPWHGGLLRIHSLASTCTSCHMPGDATMVCPACHLQANRARNMEAAPNKEPNSTCQRSV